MEGRRERRDALTDVENEAVAANELKRVPLDDEGVLGCEAEERGACEAEQRAGRHVGPAPQEATDARRMPGILVRRRWLRDLSPVNRFPHAGAGRAIVRRFSSGIQDASRRKTCAAQHCRECRCCKRKDAAEIPPASRRRRCSRTRSGRNVRARNGADARSASLSRTAFGLALMFSPVIVNTDVNSRSAAMASPFFQQPEHPFRIPDVAKPWIEEQLVLVQNTAPKECGARQHRQVGNPRVVFEGTWTFR